MADTFPIWGENIWTYKFMKLISQQQISTQNDLLKDTLLKNCVKSKTKREFFKLSREKQTLT